MQNNIEKQKIINDLRDNLNVSDGDMIVVHSSMKSLGHVIGGPDTLIDALIESVGGVECGTIVMPCFNDPLDVVDLRSTPCHLGLVPETFRKRDGVIRSKNHTHGVCAIGKRAKEILAGHINATPLGEKSPLHKLADMGGFALMIGCNLTACSTIHVAESIAQVPYMSVFYPGYDKVIKLIDENDRCILCPPFENPGCGANFSVLQPILDNRGLLTKGTIGKAISFKAKGIDIINAALEILKANASALLCINPDCPVCPTCRELF